MAKRRKMNIRKLSKKKHTSKNALMPLAVGAVLGNMANNLILRYAGNAIPMAPTLTPIAIGFLANYMKSDYSSGIIAASAVNLVSSIGKQYLPENVGSLVAGEEYVIQGQESSDPLLGADYLYGENNQMQQDELGADQFVVSGSSNDPLD